MSAPTSLRQRSRFILPLLIFVAALLPRLAAIGRYVTPDEPIWVHRSLGLRQALLQGAWADTIQSGHPGVTTTWIGAVASQIQLWLDPVLATQVAWLEQLYWLSTENAEAFRRLYLFLNSARLGVALVTSLGLVLVYLLGRELLGHGPALAAVALLALDPFFAGLSGLLHVDALLATFTLLALLLALRAAPGAERRGHPLLASLAGVAAALAILTKTPGLALLAFVPPILAWPVLRGASAARRRAVLGLGAFLVALPATALILLPALWAAPGDVLQHTLGLTGQFVEDAARDTFFLGQMTSDPGPLFYPMALLLRLSPAASAGLVLALAGLVATTSRRFRNLREVPRGAPVAVLWLLLFALVYLLALSTASLKYDRYALPALAALTVAAGWGLAWLARRLGRRGPHLLALFLLLQLAYLALNLPYPLLAYNWLAGGRAAAVRALPVGWGEAEGAAARWLAQAAPEPSQSRLFATNLPGTAPFYPGPIARLERANLARLQLQDYLLALDAPGTSGAVTLPQHALWQTIGLGPGQQARLYRGLSHADFDLPALQLEERGLRFGAAIELAAAGAVFLPWPDDVALTLAWRRRSRDVTPASYRLQLDLVDDQGRSHLHREVPFLNQNDHPPAAWPPGELQTVHYAIAAPADLPPGEYGLVARLFDAQGRQQGVFDAGGQFVGVQGELDMVAATAPAAQPPLQLPYSLAGAAPLLGHGPLPQQVATGQAVVLELWWQATETPGGRLALQVGNETAESFALQSTGWIPGQTYRLRPQWRVPLQAEAGAQALQVRWEDGEGRALWPEPVTLGQVQVVARERRFELPPGLEPLGVRLGGVAMLQGVEVDLDQETVRVQVVWQAEEPQPTSYTTFVHLRDVQGTIAAQVDRPPQPPTDSWAAGEVIVEMYELARPAAGAYTLALGLYDAGNGLRLPVYDAGGAPLPDEQYVLEVTVP